MIKSIGLLVSILLSLTCFSQIAVGDSRKSVKRNLEQYVKKYELPDNCVIETDSSLHLLLREPKFKKADFIYHFDAANKCDYELRIACDSCTLTYLNDAIDLKYYDFKQISHTTFLSNYYKQVLIEIFNKDDTYSIRFSKMHFTREDHRNIWKEFKQ